MDAKTKEIRFKVRPALHAAVKVLAEHDQETIEQWILSLIERTVTDHLAISRRLMEVVNTSDLIVASGAAPNEVVYFIQRGDGGPIKIGRTAYLDKRIAALQIGCAEKLTLLAQIPATQSHTERAIHKRFRPHRQEGEWFSPVPELLRFISELNQKREQA